jgi:hypothetical protein
MKKTLVVLMIVLLFCSLATTDASAKAAYCYKALVQCKSQCSEIYLWWTPEARGCIVGCSIGYLFC